MLKTLLKAHLTLNNLTSQFLYGVALKVSSKLELDHHFHEFFSVQREMLDLTTPLLHGMVDEYGVIKFWPQMLSEDFMLKVLDLSVQCTRRYRWLNGTQPLPGSRDNSRRHMAFSETDAGCLQ